MSSCRFQNEGSNDNHQYFRQSKPVPGDFPEIDLNLLDNQCLFQKIQEISMPNFENQHLSMKLFRQENVFRTK